MLGELDSVRPRSPRPEVRRPEEDRERMEGADQCAGSPLQGVNSCSRESGVRLPFPHLVLPRKPCWGSWTAPTLLYPEDKCVAGPTFRFRFSPSLAPPRVPRAACCASFSLSLLSRLALLARLVLNRYYLTRRRAPVYGAPLIRRVAGTDSGPLPLVWARRRTILSGRWGRREPEVSSTV